MIVYSYYVLDIIHSGHLLMMKNAKNLAGPDGKLIVGILTEKATMEKKTKPIISFEERMEVASCYKICRYCSCSRYLFTFTKCY